MQSQNQIQKCAMARNNTQMRDSTQNTRISARSSNSCTPLQERSCGCGKQVILYKSNSQKNPGRLFWRCPDWKENWSCGFFEWEKVECEAENEDSSKLNVEMKIVEELEDMMDKKFAKLSGDMEEIMVCVFGKIMEDKNEMKDKKIAKLKLKLKNEGLKRNVLLVLLVLGCAVALSKYF